MDSLVVTVAASIVSVLMPFVKKGAEEFAGEFGKIGAEKTKGILSTLKEKFSRNKDSNEVLEGFEKKPDSYKPQFMDVLLKELENDKNLASELDSQIKQVKRAGPKIEAYMKKAEGDELTVIRAKIMKAGQVTATMEDIKAKKATVAEFDSIGE